MMVTAQSVAEHWLDKNKYNENVDETLPCSMANGFSTITSVCIWQCVRCTYYNNVYYHIISQLCMHALCVYSSTFLQAYLIIDLQTLGNGGRFQCSSSSASNDQPLLKKLCVLLCMPPNAPECASEQQLPGGACPQTPLECTTAGWDIAPHMYVQPWLVTLHKSYVTIHRMVYHHAGQPSHHPNIIFLE